MANVKIRPRYQTIGGILCPMFPAERFREALNYKPKPEDVFIVTYPKCGTTWMQSVALHIFRKGRELEDPKDFHRVCPFIDPQGLKGIEEMPRPGAFKTHLPYTHVPYSPEAKYIYVLRNPKDCCVSMYYHTKGGGSQEYSEATFDDFFEIFMAGEVEYNDYFDHLMSWYPHLNDKQVFFATYEDMKKDMKDIVLRLASFLGQEYTDAIEKDNNVLNNILHFSSFEYMKNNLSGVFDRPPKHKEKEHSDAVENDKFREKPSKEKKEHLRKGVVGDWMNHFSEEQSERLNRKFVGRTQGTEIYEIYKQYMGI